MNKNDAKSKRSSVHRNKSWKIVLAVSVVFIVAILACITVEQNYTNTPPSSLEKSIDDFTLISNSTITASGKIVIIFIGAEACPFCAAESWSLVIALQQFGSLTGLTHIISNSSESIPNIPGYGFSNASYQSKEISFWEVETTGTSWNYKLQSPNSTEESFFTKYDPNGDIPFLLIGDLYLHIGSGVPPESMANMEWDQCLNEVSSPGLIHNEVQSEADNITNVIDYLENHMNLPSDIEGSVTNRLTLSTTTANQVQVNQDFPSVSAHYESAKRYALTTIAGSFQGLTFVFLFLIGIPVERYELAAKKRKDVAHFVKREISGERDQWLIFGVFRSKGGSRRLMIMEVLDGPKNRSEVAKLTYADWKEVDRNIRILESVGLVRVDKNGKHRTFYELTERGKDLVERIRSRKEG